MDERFVKDLEDSKALGDVWVLEEVEDEREPSQDKGLLEVVIFPWLY